MQLLEEVESVVDHVCLFCELILCSLDVLDREQFALGKMCEERKDEVAIAMWDNRFCEVVLGHFVRVQR